MIVADAEMWAEVHIEIDPERDPGDLFTRAATAEFQDSLYGPAVSTRETVIRHWVYNAVFNGVDDASRLDGWGDLERGVVRFRVAHPEVNDHNAVESDRSRSTLRWVRESQEADA